MSASAGDDRSLKDLMAEQVEIMERLQREMQLRMESMQAIAQRVERQEAERQRAAAAPPLPEESGALSWLSYGLFELPSQVVGGIFALPSLLVGESTVPVVPQEGAAGGVQAPRGRGTGRHAIFDDVSRVKERLAQILDKEAYNVEDLYWKEGCAQALARNEVFKNLTLVVIFLNTLWIAYDTDHDHASLLLNAPPLFQAMENLFCIYFSFEIGVRFLSFQKKRDAWKDAWFVFDFTLVALMVWETWVATLLVMISGSSGEEGGPMQNTSILRALRLFRLLRASRILRLLRQFPELMILVQAMMSATRAVCSTMMLLLILIYVFAILFTQLFQESEADVKQGCFENVPQSMYCLLKWGVFPNQTDLSDGTLDAGAVFYIIAVVYLCFSCLSVMNLLIGVICDVVSKVARAENDIMLSSDIKLQIKAAIPEIDKDGDEQISPAEFQMLVKEPLACKILADIGVDVLALVDYADFIFYDKPTLSLDQFIETVLQFRDDNPAKVKEVVDIRKCLSREIQAMELRMRRLIHGRKKGRRSGQW